METSGAGEANRELWRETADEHEVLESLMQQYGAEMKRIAFLYVHDRAECEDIIQEVFISAFKNLSKFRHEASYKTWLTRMTINKCKDHHRLWSIRNLVYKPAVKLLSKGNSAEEELIGEETAKEVAAQLAALPGKYKEVLILYYYQELTMQEISDVLEININTVKSRLLRGKQALQEKVERGAGNNGSF
ncbi:sigma-70 family RNA polymerase sigma factor [Planococcus sp. CAU13]|uniref:sigma-70 family RNA polymerase sigma factor n=1 Tax=Planococcus sp. CAU13 TaxID=1541197 RepID=UPI0006908A7F|nr:sigma-70 family RNA polymerase sigma factor [Planococcus sp. CAU13]